MQHYKISRLLNDSTLSKFVATKWIKVNYLSNGQYFQLYQTFLQLNG